MHTNIEITHEYKLILELYYTLSVFKAKHDKYDNLIEKAIEELYLVFHTQGVIIKELVNKIEMLLEPITDKAKIISLIDKQTSVEYVKDRPIGIFKYISEDSSKKMSSWCIGDYMSDEVLYDRAKITNVNVGAEKLRQAIAYSMDFGSSSNLQTTVILDKNSTQITFDTECRWQEIDAEETCIPQLQFCAPIEYKCYDYTYDIPAGLINRKPLNYDVPAMSFAMANSMEGKSIAIMSDCKYGYRGNEQ